MIVKSWNLLAVAILVFFLLAPALVWCTISLIKGNRGATLASAALVHEQEINVPMTGEVVVLVQMPRLASDFGNIQIELTEKQSGHTEVMKYSYTGAQGAVRGFDSVKMPFGRFVAPRAGLYLTRVSGLNPGKDYSNYRLIFSRPYLGRMTLQIIGIVFCAVGMLGCVIWGTWLAGLMKQGTGAGAPAGVPGRTIDLETWKHQQQNPPK